MRAYGQLVLLVYACLTPSVDGGQRSASRLAGGGERKDPPMLLRRRPVWLEKKSGVFTFVNNLLPSQEFLM